MAGGQAPLVRAECGKQVLGSGISGTTYKVCQDLACIDCYVLKEGPRVDEVEVENTEIAWNLVNGTPYARHVAEYIDKEPGKKRGLFKMYTRFQVNYGDFIAFFRKAAGGGGPAGSPLGGPAGAGVSAKQLAYFLIQVLCTADFLWTQGRYLHMDLKPDNVLAVPWPKMGKSQLLYATDNLRVESRRNVFFGLKGGPDVAYAVLIDFGNAVYQRRTDGEWVGNASQYDARPWNGRCYEPIYDMVHLLYNLMYIETLLSPKAVALLHEVINASFGPLGGVTFLRRLKNNEDLVTNTLVLTGDGCDELMAYVLNGTLKLRSFADLLLNCDSLKAYAYISEGPGDIRPFW